MQISLRCITHFLAFFGEGQEDWAYDVLGSLHMGTIFNCQRMNDICEALSKVPGTKYSINARYCCCQIILMLLISNNI